MPSLGLALPPLPALERAPELFCPPNKGERAGSSSAVFARADSHRRLRLGEKKTTEVPFCKQEENAAAPGCSQSLFWERWEQAGRSLGCASAVTFPLAGKELHVWDTSAVTELLW